MKVKKFLAVILAVIMSVTAMSVTAFADTEIESSVYLEFFNEWLGEYLKDNPIETCTIVEDMIDYSIYDSDMVYVQEDADMVEAYNEMIRSRKSVALSDADINADIDPVTRTFPEWDWTQSKIFGVGVCDTNHYAVPYSFKPVNTLLHTSIEVRDVEETPRIYMLVLNSDDTLTYKASKDLTASEDEPNTYTLENQSWKVLLDESYVFVLYAASNWDTAILEISFTFFD